MSFVKAIDVFLPHTKKAQRVSVDLTARQGRRFEHLVITGRNGSGKTVLLNHLFVRIRSHLLMTPASRATQREDHVTLDAASDGGLAKAQFLGVPRDFPAQHDKQSRVGTLNSATDLENYLNELKYKSVWAAQDGQLQEAGQWSDEIKAIESLFKSFFQDPSFKIDFDRPTGRVLPVVTYGKQKHKTQWSDLSAGLKSIIALWAAIKADGYSDIILIDEPEAHLHPALQEVILPTLLEAFPDKQFIVATHSPAVVTSVDCAWVVDLTTEEMRHSSELQGTKYGDLLKSHFHLSTDYDHQTAEKLERLRTLSENHNRSVAEMAEFRTLTDDLMKKSHTLALMTWHELHKSMSSSTDQER